MTYSKTDTYQYCVKFLIDGIINVKWYCRKPHLDSRIGHDKITIMFYVTMISFWVRCTILSLPLSNTRPIVARLVNDSLRLEVG